MNREKDFEDFAITYDFRVERHLHDFGMAGRAGADLVVSGVGDTAAGVTGDYAFDAAQVFIYRFQAPETAASQRGNFFVRLHIHNDP